jgi:UPF0755 protein
MQLRRGPSRIKLPFIITGIVLIALAGSVAFIRYQYYESLQPVSASQTSQLFAIERGATVSEVGANLKSAGLIRETWAFEWYIRNNSLRDKVQAGTYYLNPSQGVEEIASIITKGRTATDLVTILPGKRLDQLRQSLVNAGFNPDEVEAAFDPSLYADHPALVDKPADATLEGYIYPESFQKSPDTKPQVVIRAALDEMQRYLTPDIRAGFVKQGLTVHQGVILASVVEKEIGKAEDRPTVAQVFLKRLRSDIPLESDATTTYGAILNGETPTHDYDSPYNTYKHKGLMPGPISNVSKSSLKAVAFPASTDFMYFVAGNDCKTRFSHTLQEHEAFIKAHGVGCK